MGPAGQAHRVDGPLDLRAEEGYADQVDGRHVRDGGGRRVCKGRCAWAVHQKLYAHPHQTVCAEPRPVLEAHLVVVAWLTRWMLLLYFDEVPCCVILANLAMRIGAVAPPLRRLQFVVTLQWQTGTREDTGRAEEISFRIGALVTWWCLPP